MTESLPGTPENRIVIAGQVAEMLAMRHTASGVPVVGFTLTHRSVQIENGLPREVACQIEAVALGQMAQLMKSAGAGSTVKLEGFLAQKSLRNLKPLLHVERIEFLEGL